jgi:hypothetical protein
MEPKKNDAGKRSGFGLLPLDALGLVVDVLHFGAYFDAPNNWKGLDPERIYDAFWRHLTDVQSGEVCDRDSGLPHWAHIATNALFMTWFGMQGRLSSASAGLERAPKTAPRKCHAPGPTGPAFGLSCQLEEGHDGSHESMGRFWLVTVDPRTP